MSDRGGVLAPGSLADDSPREVDAHGLDEADREDVGPDERHGDDVGALRERAVDLAAGDGVVGAEEAADAGEDVLEEGIHASRPRASVSAGAGFAPGSPPLALTRL